MPATVPRLHVLQPRGCSRLCPWMLVADRFQVEALVGKGGMGEVYRARDLATGEPVALKLLTMSTSEASERFARESRLLCALRHPRVVKYVAHGLVQGQRYLAMEWM